MKPITDTLRFNKAIFYKEKARVKSFPILYKSDPNKDDKSVSKTAFSFRGKKKSIHSRNCLSSDDRNFRGSTPFPYCMYFVDLMLIMWYLIISIREVEILSKLRKMATIACFNII